MIAAASPALHWLAMSDRTAAGAGGAARTSILHGAAAGDPNSVRACVDRFGALVWSLARRSSPTREDAEDAVQEVFLDLYRNGARYDATVASEATFVAMITRRRLIDRARRRSRRLDTEELDTEIGGPSANGPGADVCAEASMAARAIADLRPEQREVLLLSTVHGLTHEEIAEARNLPLGTVKTHARRGLIRLRELLGETASEGGTKPVAAKGGAPS